MYDKAVEHPARKAIGRAAHAAGHPARRRQAAQANPRQHDRQQDAHRQGCGKHVHREKAEPDHFEREERSACQAGAGQDRPAALRPARMAPSGHSGCTRSGAPAWLSSDACASRRIVRLYREGGGSHREQREQPDALPTMPTRSTSTSSAASAPHTAPKVFQPYRFPSA